MENCGMHYPVPAAALCLANIIGATMAVGLVLGMLALMKWFDSKLGMNGTSGFTKLRLVPAATVCGALATEIAFVHSGNIGFSIIAGAIAGLPICVCMYAVVGLRWTIGSFRLLFRG
jgi:hypothetical protein